MKRKKVGIALFAVARISNRHILGVFFVAVLLWTIVPASAEERCQLLEYASLDLGTDDAGDVYVPIGINGHSENLLVDTGGVASMLTESAVRELRLNYELLSTGVIVVMPGARILYIAHADAVQLGNMRAAHVPFLVMPDHLLPKQDAGTLAPDIMGNYDIELDFSKAKFNIFSPNHCPEQVVYWTRESYAKIPVQMDAQGHISTTVQLDGKLVQAGLDTGSSRSTIGFEAAKDIFGWDEKISNLTVTSRRPDGTPSSYHFPFKTLAISGITVTDPDVVLVRQLSSDDFRIGSLKPRFQIGMGLLRQLHIYLAYHDRSLYVTSANAH